jgi:hypothetical protein
VSETTVRPTKKQRELLTFIEIFIKEHGYSPSYREIMNGLNYTSVATVALHVNSLIKRGHIIKRDHEARSLEVVGSTAKSSVSTNRVTEAQEKWLVEKVEHFFREAESKSQTDSSTVDQLYVLVGALKVLGLDGAASSFMPRLSSLKAKL